MSVCALLANLINEGLFAKAIMQSGTCDSPEFFFPLDEATAFGSFYAEDVLWGARMTW